MLTLLTDVKVCPTGHRIGAIEVVPHCTSLGKIQKNWRGAFKDGAIVDWLRGKGGDWGNVLSRFSSSLAGACILEYVLGLGDR